MFKNIVLSLVVSCFVFVAKAQAVPEDLKEETHIYHKVYNASLNIVGKKQLVFNELFAGKPLLLALVFTRCAGVCNPFLFQLNENLRLKGNNFHVLVLSFDPRDSLKDMALLAKRFGLENTEQWLFATTTDIEDLNQSIGFSPVWDSLSGQFDHDALLVGINSEGYITKKLIGIRAGHDLDLMIASIYNIFSPTYRLPNQNALFSCFNYDPTTGKNKPGLGLLFIALPALVTVALLFLMSYMARNKR